MKGRRSSVRPSRCISQPAAFFNAVAQELQPKPIPTLWMLRALPPPPNPRAAPSLGRVKRWLLPWLASPGSEELLTWSGRTSGGAAGGSEPAAQSVLASARYPPRGRGSPQSLLPPRLPFAELRRERPVGAWQGQGLPRGVICGGPSPRSPPGWSGGIKGPVWEIILFLGRHFFLAHLSQKRAQQSTRSFFSPR